ncbi:hypothetical protein [Streptomyces roseoverticillatus]|uniref:Uncharacterized protein n=1 Tax=Streptomyces roseoverticillatus TaxID=66429 RepID=A0ABV3IQW0_9ACTN
MSPRHRGRLVVLAYESGLVHPGRAGLPRRLGNGAGPRDRGRIVALAYESGLVRPGRLG